jgi:hypothetical protein
MIWSARGRNFCGIARPSFLGCLEIDHHFELGRLEHRQVGGIVPFENSAPVVASDSIRVGNTSTVAHQATSSLRTRGSPTRQPRKRTSLSQPRGPKRSAFGSGDELADPTEGRSHKKVRYQRTIFRILQLLAATQMIKINRSVAFEKASR